jgi:hypothetical protein
MQFLLLFNETTTNKIITKLLVAISVTLLLSLFTHKYYSSIKYWNVPQGYSEENGDQLKFTDIFYFNIVSWFTIGYGDFTPKHTNLKFFTIINAFCAYTIALM